MNVFICLSVYHILQTLVMSNDDDWIIVSSNILANDPLSKSVKERFYNRIIETPDLSTYKQCKFLIPYTFRKNLKCTIKTLKHTKVNNIYVFNDVTPITQYLCRNIHHDGMIILVEEGIGLYRNSHIRSPFLYQLFGKLCFGNQFHFIQRQGTLNLVSAIMCHYPELLNNEQKTKKIIIMNELQLDSLANSLHIKQIKGIDWFIGQPLVEDGIMSSNQYLNFLTKLGDLENRLHRKFVIKPHPRENLDKYDGRKDLTILSDQEIPMELLIDSRTPVNVFTFFSSAVLQLSTNANIHCFLLYKMLTSYDKEMDTIFSCIQATIPGSFEEFFKELI